jgi:hypothetical protein
MKVASNVRTKKKITAGPGPGDGKPGDGKKKDKLPEPEAGMIDIDPHASSHSKDKVIFNKVQKPIVQAAAERGSNKFYSGGAAPRVGGAAVKSTTVYTGSGASANAKKVKRSGATNKNVRSVTVRRRP